MFVSKIFSLCLLSFTSGYWDIGTTTIGVDRTDNHPRTSFFRWQRTESASLRFFYPYYDWTDISYRRRTSVMAGISIDFTPLSVATLMNRRILITSANYLDPHMHRQKMLRIWALGRAGRHDTPYRYRVWRVHRVFPKSNNPEHQHGARGLHSPRHDVAIIFSWDQIYIYYMYPLRYQYAYWCSLVQPRETLNHVLIFMASGFEYMTHLRENYKIFYGLVYRSDVVDCSRYLPKWWGKFICIKNVHSYPGLQNGGALMQSNTNTLLGLGCFEIRYNEVRILVFTDLRYYRRPIDKYASLSGGDYYEFAYPHWGVRLDNIYDGQGNMPIIPHYQKRWDLYPLG